MAKTFVMVLGVIFVVLGVLGFVPGLTPSDELFGIFAISTSHNLVHLISGVVALGAAATGEANARLFAKVFGVAYGLVTILGFIQGDGAMVLGFIPVNQADNVLHLVIAAGLLYVGFAEEGETSRAAA